MFMLMIFSGNNLSERAYEDPAMNRIDFINEIFYYFVLLTSFAFTLYNSNEASKIEIGVFFDFLIGSMLIYNAAGMILS